MSDPPLPNPSLPAECLADEVLELRLLRVLGPGDAEARPPEARFLARAPEYRFAIHLRGDGTRVGRIHLRVTDDPAIVGTMGHSGYEIGEPYRRQGYAARALGLVRRIARHQGVAPLWVFIEPENTASRRTAERAGLRLVDTVPSAPEAIALSHGPRLCRYAVEHP